MTNIASQLQLVLSEIDAAAQHAQRSANDIQLLAVSKTKPAEQVKAAYLAGQRKFGESYAQEAVDKIQLLSQDADIEGIEWHFIGPLQSNKTRLIAAHFDWVQSVDRVKIARRLQEQRPDSLPPLRVCLQVNISEEESKSGSTLTEVFELAKEVANMSKLELRGIMAIPQHTDDPTILHQQFRTLHETFLALQQQYATVDTLSMGMSGDLAQAIREGSNMVRVGTAIFGKREQRKS